MSNRTLINVNGMKVSLPNIDVNIALPNQLIFDSNFRVMEFVCWGGLIIGGSGSAQTIYYPEPIIDNPNELHPPFITYAWAVQSAPERFYNHYLSRGGPTGSSVTRGPVRAQGYYDRVIFSYNSPSPVTQPKIVRYSVWKIQR